MQKKLLAITSIVLGISCFWMWYEGYTSVHWTLQFTAEMLGGASVFALMAAIFRPEPP